MGLERTDRGAAVTSAIYLGRDEENVGGTTITPSLVLEFLLQLDFLIARAVPRGTAGGHLHRSTNAENSVKRVRRQVPRGT